MSPDPNLPRIAISDVPNPGGGYCRWIELRRPEKLNCLNLRMLDELLLAIQNHQAHCLILSGAGRSFCTGLDLKEIAGPVGARAHLRRLIRIYQHLLNLAIPTVVLAKGYAAGGGAGLVACARTAIVSTDFRFRLPSGDLAPLASVVVPLCNLRAQKQVPDMSGWLGCDLDAAEAHRLGLVDQVVSPERMKQMIEDGKKGVLFPEWLQGKPRNPTRISRTLLELNESIRHCAQNLRKRYVRIVVPGGA